MPVVTVKIPESGQDPLLKQLLTQFESLRKQLQKLEKPSDSSSKIVQMVTRQQDALVKVMERMIGKISDSKGGGRDDAILQAMKGLKKAISGLPSDLKSAVGASYKRKAESLSRPRVTVKPQVNVSMNGLNRRLGKIEDALTSAVRKNKWSSRTFGSNL